MKAQNRSTSIAIGLASLVVVAWLNGCSPAATESLVIRGSNTVGEELAPRLAEEYKKEHRAVAFDMEFKGTSYGLGALMVGKCDIAAASRELAKNEMDLAKDRSVQFNDYVIGAYSVAVVVNAASPVSALTKAQARDIFTGVIQNWKDVGGPDAPIQLCVRDPISGTHLGFKEVAMENQPYASSLKTFTNYNAIAQAVAANPNAIGYTSVELATSKGIKGVSIEGVAPTLANVQKATYPYQRTLRLYTDKSRESANAKDFIQFIRSDRGQKILDQMGYVPKT